MRRPVAEEHECRPLWAEDVGDERLLEQRVGVREKVGGRVEARQVGLHCELGRVGGDVEHRERVAWQ
jgi:hypothetical protein